MWNKRTNTSKMPSIRHCERVAVEISYPKIMAPTFPPYNASSIKEGTQHVIEACLFEFESSSKLLSPPI